jgi:hypothetical protein
LCFELNRYRQVLIDILLQLLGLFVFVKRTD